jgi:hypothetical protein
VRRATIANLDPGFWGPADVMCNPGERAVGGGGGFTGNGSSEELMQSFPLSAPAVPAADGDIPRGWRVFLKNENTFTMPAPKAYVVCARP